MTQPKPVPNPFSPPVQSAFDDGARALNDDRTDDAVAHLTRVGTDGNHNDRLLLADFLIAARDTGT